MSDEVSNPRYTAVLERERRHRLWIYRLLPGYRYSNEIYEDLIVKRLTPEALWLDLGCGDNTLAFEFGDRCAAVVGLDRGIHPQLRKDNKHPVVQGEAAELPFRPGSVNLVTGNTVLEHLNDPGGVFREMARVLKPGGSAVLRTPNKAHPLVMAARCLPDGFKKRLLKGLLGIREWDVFPALYRANKPGTLRRLCREAGFTDIEILAVEDVHAAYFVPRLISLAYYLVVRAGSLSSWRSNFVVTLRK